MGSLTRNDAVSSVLTDIAVGYSMDDASDYVAPRLPEGAYLKVTKRAGQIYKWDKGDMLRRDAEKRASGSKYERGGVGLGTVSYSCEEYGLEIPIDDDNRKDFSADGLDIEEAYASKIMGNILQEKDDALDAAVFLTGTWSTDWDGVTSGPGANQFVRFDQSASVPLVDIPLAMSAVRNQCGRKPNLGIVGSDCWTKGLAFHADILDLYKHTQTGVLTPQMVARALGLDAILVAESAENTAQEGATASISNIIQTNDMWLGYVSPRMGNLEPSAFKIVTFADSDIPRGVLMEYYRDEESRSDIVRGRAHFDVLITAADAGAFLEDAVD